MGKVSTKLAKISKLSNTSIFIKYLFETISRNTVGINLCQERKLIPIFKRNKLTEMKGKYSFRPCGIGEWGFLSFA